MREEEITFVIPTFGIQEDRMKNLEFVLRKISEASKNVLVVEQVSPMPCAAYISPAQTFAERNGVRYLRIEIDDTRIHKSRLINEGVAQCKTPYVWVNDVDCYLKYTSVLPEVELIEDFIQPYTLCKLLDPAQSDLLRTGHRIKVAYEKIRADRGYKSPSMRYRASSLYAGGMFVFRKASFNEIGGMDERYVGWGCEDTDLCWRVLHSDHTFMVCDHKCVHLWHRPSEGSILVKSENDYRLNFEYFCHKHDLPCDRPSVGRVLQEKYQEKLYSLALIGIGRSGTTCISRTIEVSTGIPVINEPFGVWGMKTNRDKVPFGGLLDAGEYRQYYDSIIKKVPLIKHHFLMGRDSFPDDDIRGRCPEASGDLCKTRTDVIFITRNNFYDFLVSFFLANEEKNWFRNDYSHTPRKISKWKFNLIFTKWYDWHYVTLPKLIAIREFYNKPYHVVDYEQIADPEFLRGFVLKNIPGSSSERFSIPTKRQKTRSNEDYISNYDEVLRWARGRCIGTDGLYRPGRYKPWVVTETAYSVADVVDVHGVFKFTFPDELGTIKVMNSGNVGGYRLGDVIRLSPTAISQAMLQDDKSLGCRLAKLITSGELSTAPVDWVRGVISGNITGGVDTPGSKTLCVHLRCWDKLPRTVEFDKSIVVKYVESVKRLAKTHNLDRVVLVTAAHFHCEIDSRRVVRSLRIVDSILNELRSEELDVTLRSSDSCDDDFIYLSKAHYLLCLGHSAFSNVAALVGRPCVYEAVHLHVDDGKVWFTIQDGPIETTVSDQIIQKSSLDMQTCIYKVKSLVGPPAQAGGK